MTKGHGKTNVSTAAVKQYVTEQLETMKKHGLVSKLSSKQYEAVVKKVAEVTAKSTTDAEKENPS